MEKTHSIEKKFKEGTYERKPARRACIPKPGKNKKKPIDTPTQQDRIVQEAIRGILDEIFEPEFSAFEEKNVDLCTNFGFRNNKSTWLAIENLQKKGQGANYAIKGNIIGAYNNVNHKLLIEILQKRIGDKKFL